MTDCCLWCDHPFRPNPKGKPQRFCSPKCRAGFWRELRLWAFDALASGVITIDLIKGRHAAVYGLTAPIKSDGGQEKAA